MSALSLTTLIAWQAPPAANAPSAGSTVWIVAATAGGFGVMVAAFILARRWRARQNTPTVSAAFTLDDLRQMKERNEINAVEFETLRQAMIERLRSATGAKPPKRPG